MTITRIFEAHAETGVGTELLVWDATDSVTQNIVSSTKAKSGTYSFKAYDNYGYYKYIPTTAQLRGSFHLNHTSSFNNSPSEFLSLYSGITYIAGLTFLPSAATITFLLGATPVATAFSAAFGIIDTWRHCAFDIKIAVAGWFNFYLDGILILSYAGDTTLVGGSVNQIQFFTNGQWFSSVYLDDIYLDDTTGEVAPTLAPDRRFTYQLPSGNGAISQFLGSDGNSVSNYLLVDERPIDNDLTYVAANSSGLRDLYDTVTFTSLVSGSSIIAVSPIAIVRKTEIALATTIKLLSKNGASETLSVAKDVLHLPYTLVADRQLLQPNGTAWNAAAVNATEFGYESAGVYS